MSKGIGLGKPGAWLLAARPKTLPAAAAPVAVGTALAYADGVVAWLPALAALAGALLIQIGTNFANDYYDYLKGADTDERVGPTRVTQAGLLHPHTVRTGMIVAFSAAVSVGLYLVAVGGWPIVAIGVASVIAGVAYTGGPYPLGYHGLGDVFVLVFFGPVAVGGTYFVQAQTVTSTAIVLGLALGALATAILVVNNVRDMETDRKAGKRTLVVRFGDRAGRAEYAVLLASAYAAIVGLYALGRIPGWALLAVVALPLALLLAHRVWHTPSRVALNPLLGQTAAHLLVFSILLSAGLVT